MIASTTGRLHQAAQDTPPRDHLSCRHGPPQCHLRDLSIQGCQGPFSLSRARCLVRVIRTQLTRSCWLAGHLAHSNRVLLGHTAHHRSGVRLVEASRATPVSKRRQHRSPNECASHWKRGGFEEERPDRCTSCLNGHPPTSTAQAQGRCSVRSASSTHMVDLGFLHTHTHTLSLSLS